MKSLSNPSGSPHVVSVGGNNITCDNIVLYERFGYCSHCLVVANKRECCVEYAKHLQRTSVSSLTKTASENVDSKSLAESTLSNHVNKTSPLVQKNRMVQHKTANFIIE